MDCFSEIYAPIHSVQLLMLFLRKHRFGLKHSYPQITGSPWTGRALFPSFLNRTQLLDSNNWWLVALLFSTMPWGIKWSVNNPIKFWFLEGIVSEISVWFLFWPLEGCWDFYSLDLSCKLARLRYSLYLESPLKCLLPQPPLYFRILLGFNFFVLCCKWGNKLGAICFMVRFSLWANLWASALKLVVGDNGKVLSEWYSHCRSWELNGRRRDIVWGPLSFPLLGWNNQLTIWGKSDLGPSILNMLQPNSTSRG